MMEDRPAPVVTITDPRRPLEPGDMLVAGDEKPPWRLKRWHYEAAALVVALAVAAVVPQQLLAASAADHRAALAAQDNARVALSALFDQEPEKQIIAVVGNDGPDEITVLSLRLLADGFEDQEVTATVATNDSVQVPVQDTLPCSETLLTRPSVGRASVRLRVAGRPATRTVLVPFELSERLIAAAQDRCGYLPGSRALEVSADVRAVGSELAVTLVLSNNGRLPLLVRSAYSLNPGVLVRGAPQSVLIPAGATAAPYRFRVGIGNCLDVTLTGDDGPIQLQLDAETQLAEGFSSSDAVGLTQPAPSLLVAIRRLIEQRCRRS